MESYFLDWANLLLRWAHVITAIAWVGSSFYFVYLDANLTPPVDPALKKQGVDGELWAVHGGGFYHPVKFNGAPPQLPGHLHWFYWESYSTWLTGFALFSLSYLWSAGTYLIDKSVMNWAPGAAIGVALSFLAVFWLLYDAVCRLLGDRSNGDAIVGALVLVLVCAASWLACHWFAGRASFLLVGAMIATAMSANVLFWIIPGQRKVVAAIKAGQPVDPIHGRRGKQRSVHNTYFTLPVLFAMLSNHYSFTWNHPRNWLVLILMMFAGAAIRQFFVMRHGWKLGRNSHPLPYALAGVAVLAGVVVWLRPEALANVANATPQAVGYQQVQQVLAQRCYACHGPQVQMKNVRLDSPAALKQHAQAVYQQAVVTKVMPMNNATGITEAERALIAQWFQAGAPRAVKRMDDKLILDYVFDHHAAHPRKVFLTQPVGGGRVIDYTWDDVLDQARRMASHLRSFGFESGARIAILSKNCAHFFMAELAIWMAGGTTVAIFPTETAETVRYVLEDSEASLLFVGKLDIWPQQASAVPAGLPCIAFPMAPPTPFEAWDAIVARTEPLPGRPQRSPGDLAMLIYTSGSTGEPKGVMLTFNAVTRATEGIVNHSKALMPDVQEGRVLSYLPLAHSFERAWVEAAALLGGQLHVFFAESLETFLADLRRARPTVFISVPRLWLKFQQGVFMQMPPQKLDRLLRIPVIGRNVGRKVLKGLGLDQVRRAGSGSAPIPAELIEWYRRLGLNLVEGYGMTEDFAYSHSTSEQHNAPGYVGVPLPGVQTRLSDDGEILIKSPGQFIGYYKRPDLNAQAFTEDGFFRTGDQGERNAQGLLRVTGRVKEPFKTAKGEYVAPAPIENRLNAHPMVELSLVSGVGQSAAYAMVVLAEDLRARIGDSAVRARVQEELARLLEEVNRGLAAHQRLAMIVVANEAWSIENGLLTPTMKIRRSRIEATVTHAVESWYATGSAVHWA